MEQITDITKQDYHYNSPYNGEKLDVRLEALTYGHNGTLAISMVCHTRSIMEIEELTRMGMSWEAADEMEDYATLTVNLEGSDRLPLNVQFIDENNLPGIGDWLEKNGIAQPTGLKARSGWCEYPAYAFNLPKEKLEEVLQQRMKKSPLHTGEVLKPLDKESAKALKDDLDRCMTLYELKDSWHMMPEPVRDQITFPESIAIDGKEYHTVKEWEQERFTAPLPKDLPAWCYQEARIRFDEYKDKFVPSGCRIESFPIPEGELRRYGNIELNQVTHYFPTEYSNPFLVEERGDDGKILKEYFAIDTSYNDNVKSGPCIEHIGELTAFTMYSADITSDLCLRDARCTFSPKGALITVMEGDFGPQCGQIRQTDRYMKAVDSCRECLHKALEKAISRLETMTKTQNKSKGIGR